MRVYEVMDNDRVTARYTSRLAAIAHAVTNNIRVVDADEVAGDECAGCFDGRVVAEGAEGKSLIDSLVDRIRQTFDADFNLP